jgi:hypothetical protein
MKGNFENRLRHLEEIHPRPETTVYRVGNPVWMEIECQPEAVIRRFFRDDTSLESEFVMLSGGAGSMREFAPDGAVIEEVPLVGGVRLDQHPEATRASFQQDPEVQRKVEQIRDSGNCKTLERESKTCS